MNWPSSWVYCAPLFIGVWLVWPSSLTSHPTVSWGCQIIVLCWMVCTYYCHRRVLCWMICTYYCHHRVLFWMICTYYYHRRVLIRAIIFRHCICNYHFTIPCQIITIVPYSFYIAVLHFICALSYHIPSLILMPYARWFHIPYVLTLYPLRWILYKWL